jgi:hypothetical protein
VFLLALFEANKPSTECGLWNIGIIANEKQKSFLRKKRSDTARVVHNIIHDNQGAYEGSAGTWLVYMYDSLS